VPEAVAPQRRSRLKNIVGGSAGNLVEWFDWYVYSAFALYFAHHFFPTGDQTAQLLQTAAVFAVGFIMRPVGAWLMGIYADHRGRKAGLSLGGEYGSSATYMSEIADRERRGFWSSFLYVTIIGGQLSALALLVTLQAILGEDAMQSWGWRIGFVAGAVLAIVVFFIRRGLDETLSYENVAMQAQRRPSTLLNLIRHHPREALLVIAITAGGTASFYTYTVYMQKYLANTIGFDRATASLIMTLALTIMLFLQPLAGRLSDKVGRRPVMIFFGLCGTLFTYPLFVALEQTQSVVSAFLLVLAALVMVTGYTSINAIVKAELFPAEIRALGVALPYAIANTIFGGTAEYVALYLKDIGHERWFYIYISLLCLMYLIACIRMRETKTRSLILED